MADRPRQRGPKRKFDDRETAPSEAAPAGGPGSRPTAQPPPAFYFPPATASKCPGDAVTGAALGGGGPDSRQTALPPPAFYFTPTAIAPKSSGEGVTGAVLGGGALGDQRGELQTGKHGIAQPLTQAIHPQNPQKIVKEFKISNDKVGLICIKDNVLLNYVQSKSGAEINVIVSKDASKEATVQIKGTQENIDVGEQMVNEFIRKPIKFYPCCPGNKIVQKDGYGYPAKEGQEQPQPAYQGPGQHQPHQPAYQGQHQQQEYGPYPAHTQQEQPQPAYQGPGQHQPGYQGRGQHQPAYQGQHQHQEYGPYPAHTQQEQHQPAYQGPGQHQPAYQGPGQHQPAYQGQHQQQEYGPYPAHTQHQQEVAPPGPPRAGAPRAPGSGPHQWQ